MGDQEGKDLLLSRLTSRGIKQERIKFLGQNPCKKEHLSTYQEIDIALDTFPVSGATTTMETLWMGVPLITLYAHRHSGRVSTSMLTQMNLTEGITHTKDDYIQRAIAWANDREQLIQWRKTIRKRMMQSPLGDAPAFTRELEAAYLKMATKA